MLTFMWVFLIIFISSLFAAALPIGYYMIWFSSKPIIEWSIYLLPPFAVSIIWTGFVFAIWYGLFVAISESLKDRE